MTAKLIGPYREDRAPGIHGAAEWLLRQWQQSDSLKMEEKKWMKDKTSREANLRQIREEFARGQGKAVPQWYMDGQGYTMIVIPGPIDFLMGSPPNEVGRAGGTEGKVETQHNKRINHTFAISSREVMVGQFRRFREGHEYNKQYPPSDYHPTNMVNWYEAAAYCNWLSEQEGIDESQWCYEPKKGKALRDWSQIT